MKKRKFQGIMIGDYEETYTIEKKNCEHYFGLSYAWHIYAESDILLLIWSGLRDRHGYDYRSFVNGYKIGIVRFVRHKNHYSLSEISHLLATKLQLMRRI